MNHYKTNLWEELHRLTEAVQASHADIAPTYLEYTQLAFAIATDCGEAGRADFMSLCSLSPKHDSAAAEKLFSNALHTCKGDIHLGSVFHLAEMCGVRVAPSHKNADADAADAGPFFSHTRTYLIYACARVFFVTFVFLSRLLSLSPSPYPARLFPSGAVSSCVRC